MPVSDSFALMGEKVINLAPNNANNIYGMSYTHMALKQYDKAIEEIVQQIENGTL